MSLSNVPYKVRQCTSSEWYKIAKEPQIADRVREVTGRDVAPFVLGAQLLQYREYTLLFHWEVVRADTYQAHIAVPLDSIRASRVMSLLAINWLFTTRPELNMLIIVPMKGKMTNMAEKLGFIRMPSSKINMYYLTRYTLGDLL